MANPHQGMHMQKPRTRLLQAIVSIIIIIINPCKPYHFGNRKHIHMPFDIIIIIIIIIIIMLPIKP
jgi:hypothetical protein